MIPLPVKVSGTRRKTFRVEVDALRFERMAAGFGLFNPEFLESIERAEADIRAGRVRAIKSFSDLRHR